MSYTFGRSTVSAGSKQQVPSFWLSNGYRQKSSYCEFNVKVQLSRDKGAHRMMSTWVKFKITEPGYKCSKGV